jgi:hypothetical protein
MQNVALYNRNHVHAAALKPTTLALTGDRCAARSPAEAFAAWLSIDITMALVVYGMFRREEIFTRRA